MAGQSELEKYVSSINNAKSLSDYYSKHLPFSNDLEENLRGTTPCEVFKKLNPLVFSSLEYRLKNEALSATYQQKLGTFRAMNLHEFAYDVTKDSAVNFAISLPIGLASGAVLGAINADYSYFLLFSSTIAVSHAIFRQTLHPIHWLQKNIAFMAGTAAAALGSGITPFLTN